MSKAKVTIVIEGIDPGDISVVTDADEAVSEDSTPENKVWTAKELKKLDRDDLKQVAEALGVEFGSRTRTNTLIESILEAQEEAEEEEDDDEEEWDDDEWDEDEDEEDWDDEEEEDEDDDDWEDEEEEEPEPPKRKKSKKKAAKKRSGKRRARK